MMLTCLAPHIRRISCQIAVISTAFLAVATTVVPVRADTAVMTDWVEGYNNRSRLHAGQSGNNATIYAALEIEMPEGWKTYWRFPGEAGGIPPEIDVSKSDNLTAAKLLFPAPRRIKDKAGDLIGYKSAVTFPIVLTPEDKSKPIQLQLMANYGVCQDICVPAEAIFTLNIPADASSSPAIDAALAEVPARSVDATSSSTDAPTLSSWEITGEGDTAVLKLDVRAAGDPDEVDVFVDAADGTYIPMTQKQVVSKGQYAFTVPLTDGVSHEALIGKALTVTMVSGKGHRETNIDIKK